MTHIFIALAIATLSGGLLGGALIGIYVRHKTEEEMATAVAQALADSNTVLVDGVQLPRPEDERWTQVTRTSAVDRKTEIECLEIGGIAVSNHTTQRVYVGGNALPGTQSLRDYTLSVWRAHATRTTLKAIR